MVVEGRHTRRESGPTSSAADSLSQAGSDTRHKIFPPPMTVFLSHTRHNVD
jgi:hypothetical protein